MKGAKLRLRSRMGAELSRRPAAGIVMFEIRLEPCVRRVLHSPFLTWGDIHDLCVLSDYHLFRD
jgi:hypothetical protein